jgi:hypothetical protein
MGNAPLFAFYRNDDFSSSLEAQLLSPKNESLSWNFRVNNSMRFFGAQGAELEINNIFLNSFDNRLTNSLGAAWTSPVQKSLLGTVYDAAMERLLQQELWPALENLGASEYLLFRRITLNFIYEKNPKEGDTDNVRYSVTAGHEMLLRVTGSLNLSSFARLRIWQDAQVFSFLVSFGTSLQLMF